MVMPLDAAVAEFLDFIDGASPNLLTQHPALAERVEALREALALTFAELKHAKVGSTTPLEGG